MNNNQNDLCQLGYSVMVQYANRRTPTAGEREINNAPFTQTTAQTEQGLKPSPDLSMHASQLHLVLHCFLGDAGRR